MAKKAKKTANISDSKLEPIESGLSLAPEIETPAASSMPAVKDPIGDVSDGEARTSLADEVKAEPGMEQGSEGEASESQERSEYAGSEPEFVPSPRPPAKLERLQKILSQAGVASRRKAEEMIEQGRVQVNGKVVTELGTKADAARDHVRVDGKLLHGAERLRYFVLNKPKGFVTTVKDPEGRPTVMQFFDKMRERLYPVGRLDYMSEGLLMVTNDGELANRLTKAGSGVEKTYLVKVAGQPSESELDILRSGVSIERGKPGSPQVRTSPARIRQVRQGDNPWYEVVLIEGRNRELRKMFSAVGHFVEKIRRVGYGPLVLDQEPGNMRELQPEELAALRLAAEGTLRTPKAKEVRRRNLADAQLPTVPPKPSRPRPAAPFAARKPFEPRKFDKGPADAARPGEFPPRRPFGADKPFRPGAGPAKSGAAARPAWKKNDRPAAGQTFADRPAAARTFTSKAAWKKPEREQRPPYKRPPVPRADAAPPAEDLAANKSFRLRIDPVTGPDQSSPAPSGTARSSPARPFTPRPRVDRFSSDRPRSSRPGPERSSSAKPFRGEGGLSRPFTTSSGKPRAGGARPSSKPGKPSGGSYGARSTARPASGSQSIDSRTGSGYRPAPGGKRRFDAPSRPTRPYTPRAEGATESGPRGGKPYPNSASRAERKPGPGWKPKTAFAAGKPASGPRSKPKPGGFSKSGYKGKPGGSSPKRTGPRPGGKKRS